MIINHYNDLLARRWEASEFTGEDDRANLHLIPPDIVHLIKGFLLFTVVGDDDVINHTNEYLYKNISDNERKYLDLKQENEQVHSTTYKNLFSAYSNMSIDDAIILANNDPMVIKKRDFMRETCKKYKDNYSMLRVSLAIEEIIFFSSLFFYADYLDYVIPNTIIGREFIDSNRLIRFDETLHGYAYIDMAKVKDCDIIENEVYNILDEAISIENETFDSIVTSMGQNCVKDDSELISSLPYVVNARANMIISRLDYTTYYPVPKDELPEWVGYKSLNNRPLFYERNNVYINLNVKYNKSMLIKTYYENN